MFYSLEFISAIVRILDYYFTDNTWFISSSIEKSFSIVDLILSFVSWFVIVTSPSELDQGELVDFEDDDDGVLVLHDGRVVRNVSKIQITNEPQLTHKNRVVFLA